MYKQALRTFAVLLTASLSRQVIAQAIPNRQTKEAEVRAIISQFAEARNAHDGNAVAALYTPDGEWIQMQGPSRAYGREELAKLWGGLPEAVVRKVSSVEFPGPSIAVVHVSFYFQGSIYHQVSTDLHSEVFVLIDTRVDRQVNRNGHEWKIKIHQTLE